MTEKCEPPPGKYVVHVSDDAGGIQWRGIRYKLDALTPPATVAALVKALEGLLEDTQHAEHNCGDDDCPVRRARAAVALYRECRAMSDHIPDTGKMVPEEALTIAAAIVAEETTRCLWENISAQWLSRMRAALAAVAPLIAAQERERCARVAEERVWEGTDDVGYYRQRFLNGGALAAAIRALGDADE